MLHIKTYVKLHPTKTSEYTKQFPNFNTIGMEISRKYLTSVIAQVQVSHLIQIGIYYILFGIHPAVTAWTKGESTVVGMICIPTTTLIYGIHFQELFETSLWAGTYFDSRLVYVTTTYLEGWISV